jgi:hypothetical protein
VAIPEFVQPVASEEKKGKRLHPNRRLQGTRFVGSGQEVGVLFPFHHTTAQRAAGLIGASGRWT